MPGQDRHGKSIRLAVNSIVILQGCTMDIFRLQSVTGVMRQGLQTKERTALMAYIDGFVAAF
ncbi:MAG: hypothetical protein WBQ78_17485 [Gammaproteobacteria bacterium]